MTRLFQVFLIFFAILTILWLLRGLFLPKFKRQNAITQEELASFMEQGVPLIDVRLSNEYAKGHIPGALSIPAEKIEEEFPKRFPNKKEPYVFYCGSGVRSDIVIDNLEKMGYKNLHSFRRIKRYQGELER